MNNRPLQSLEELLIESFDLKGFRERSGLPHPLSKFASNGAIKRAVAQDLGVAILSRFATALEMQIGHLVELQVDGFPLHRQWHLVYARDKRLGPVDEAFLRFLEDGRWKDTIGHPVTTD